MKDLERFAWAIAVIIMLGLGIFAGHSITTANKDTELMDLQAQVDTANASLADAAIELAFWRGTLRELAEGGQLETVDLKGRPSRED